MRNLKRALCLALASVMTLGMMVVGSSAAELKTVNDFADASEIENVQAATINTAIGIFEGMGDGNFNPSGTVTRAQMAVIVGKIRGLTEADAANLAGSSPFTDTPEWADGWISYASANKIIVGRGNNIFDPDATVTTAEAVVMLCKALGYFQNEAEFGQNWKLAAANLASSLGLYGDLRLSVDAGLSRDNVSELAFHTLTDAVPVKYNSSQDTYYTGSAWTEGVKFDFRDTLGYQNFDLMYAAKASNDETSIYGRPVDKVWGTGTLSKDNIDDDGEIIAFDSDLPSPANGKKVAKLTETIYTETSSPDYVYTTDVSWKDVYKDLGSTAAGYAGSVYNASPDAVATFAKDTVKNNKDNTATFNDGTNGAKLGRITEIYVDDDDDTLKIVLIDQKFSEIKSVKTEDGKTIVTLKDEGSKEYETDQAFSKDDKVVYTIGMKDKGTKTKDEVIGNVYLAQSVTGKVTGVGNKGVSVTVDGTKYDVSYLDQSDVSSIKPNDEWTFYLDNNGYVVGQDEVKSSGAGNYLYVTKAATSGVDKWEATVIFEDGTKKTITVVDGANDTGWDGKSGTTKPTTGNAASSTEKQWPRVGDVFAYSESSGNYTLKNVTNKDMVATDETTIKIVKGQATLKDGAYTADSDTVFVDTDAKKAYTGYNTVPTYKDKSTNTVSASAILLYDKGESSKSKKTVDFVFITGKYNTDDGTDDKEFVYVTADDAAKYEAIKIGDDDYRVYTAYVDGKETDLNVKVDKDVNGDAQGLVAGVNYIERNSSGNVTKGGTSLDSAYNNIGMYEVLASNDTSLNYKAKSGDTTTYIVNYTDDTVFVLVDGNDVDVADANDVAPEADADDGEDYTYAYAVKKTGTDYKDTATGVVSFDAETVFLFLNTKPDKAGA